MENIVPVMTANNNNDGWVANASSEFSAGYEAFRAFDHIAIDNYTNDIWASSSSEALPAYLQIQSPDIYTIYSAKITGRILAPGQSPKTFTLRSSMNGTDWVIISAQENLSWEAGETKEFIFDRPVNLKYFKIVITEVVSGGIASILELQLIGTPYQHISRSVFSPLNLHPDLALANHRLLGADSSIPICRVRRVTAGDEVDVWDFLPNTDKYKLTSTGEWLDGSSETFYVVKWYDQSGNGKDFAQATESYQPQVVLNQVNGYPDVIYSGGQCLTHSTNAFLYDGDDFSAIADIKPSALNGYDGIISTITANGVAGWGIKRENGNSAFDFYYNTDIDFASSVIGTRQILTAIKNVLSLNSYTNSTPDNTATLINNTHGGSSNYCNIGTYRSNENEHYFEGNINNIIIVPKAISQQNIDDLYSYLQGY